MMFARTGAYRWIWLSAAAPVLWAILAAAQTPPTGAPASIIPEVVLPPAALPPSLAAPPLIPPEVFLPPAAAAEPIAPQVHLPSPAAPESIVPTVTLPPTSAVILQEMPKGPEPIPTMSGPIRREVELQTWWRDLILQPVGAPEAALPMELERAVVQAIAQSARVQVMRETAMIATTLVPQAEATFDPIAFLDSRFTDTSDPVGSSLTTGGNARFIDQNWYSSGGIRKQALTGAQFEMAQRLGWENTNSIYFTPKNQATAKLTMNVTQPLLRGAGYAYNNGIVVLANLDVQMAQAQFCTDLQSYLVDFHNAFWDIYVQRVVLLQRRRLLEEAREILHELELRRDVDVQVSQLARAKAAVANRDASLLRYQTAVKDAVSRFKALVNDPYLDNSAITELIPLDSPNAGFGDADLTVSLATSLEYRPEIEQSLRQIRSCAQRLDIAASDVLPMLNFVLGTYVNGLQGQSDFAQAFGNQYSVGRPTYWAGLIMERPIGNRGPRAVQQQRILELQRATSQLRVITAMVRAEVEIAVREVSTTRGEMIGRHQAMLSEQDQVEYLLQRWRLLPGDQQVAGVVFNDLLDAQDRRAAAEFEFVTSQVAHRVAWVKLRRAMGTLCNCTAASAEELAASVAASAGSTTQSNATEPLPPVMPSAASAPPPVISLPQVEPRH